MALSNDLISQFVKVTNDSVQTNKESTAYGKIVKQGDIEYVQLDGSELLTPISATTVVKDGDRVMVTIKNHTAVVTGDFTNPSASNKDVVEIGDKISDFEIVIADKISTEQLEAEIARIENLQVENMKVVNAEIETINGKVAKIDKIETDIIEVNGKIEAHEGEFTTIRGDIADFKNLTAENFEAVEGNFNNLNSDYANFKVTTTNTLNAHEGNFDNINADIANFKSVTTDKIEAVEGNFNNLNSDYANFKETTTDKFTANEASINELETKKLDAETAKILYANIDFSNIKEAAIEKLFTESGIIKDLVMSEGKVTGELVGVTIKGDLIEGNTLKADKLVILGTDGLYYKLNVNALGEATASSDPKYQNGLDGSAIIAKSITAEKVAVTDLVAFGATIGGFNITNNAIYSGAKGTVNNTLAGIYQDKEGQFAVGNDVNFVKFYKDQNGKFKLDISADNISFGSEKKTVESLYESINNNTEDLTNYIEATNKELINLQGQIDGSIMTWFYEYEPKNNNVPASEWITTDLKNNHLGDLFYDTITGYCYRWQVLNNVYSWQRITDVDVTKALADAKNAQDTADSKRRSFTATPTPPYDVGDVWYQGTSGDIMVCKTAKTKDQSYSSSDWVKASKYTDDTAVNTLGTRVTAAETSIVENSNAIQLRATKTEVTEQISNIEIGGRNLVLNSATLDTRYGTYNKYQGNKIVVDDSDALSGKHVEFECTNTGGYGGFYVALLENAPNRIGKTFTWSFEAKSSREISINVGPENGGTKDIALTTEWQKYKHTWVMNDNTYYSFHFYRNCEIGDILYIRDIKIEDGDKATSWTPAPEDVDSNIDSVKNDLSTNYYTKTETDAKIQVESDRITSTVSKVETVEKTANAAQTAADNAQADIDNIEVGGRNLILNSNFERGLNYPRCNVTTRTSGWNISTGNTTLSTDVMFNKHKTIHRYRTGITTDSWSENQYYYFRDNNEINNDTEYVLTFYIYTTNMDWITSTNTIASAVRLRGENNESLGEVSFSDIRPTKANVWQKREYKFAIPASKNCSWFYIVDSPRRDVDYYLANYKMEIGNKATDWTPAPEDINSNIDGVKNDLSTNYYTKTETDAKVKIESDRITTTVSKVETVEKTANNAQTAADNAQADIDNLEVGGRNLWLNSANCNSYNGTINGTSNIQWNLIDESVPSKTYFSFDIPSGGTDNSGIYFTYQKIIGTLDRLESNEIYTLSFYAKATTNTSLITGNIAESQTIESINTNTIGPDWKKIIVVFKWTNTSKFTTCFYCVCNIESVNTICISSMKLEKGNKATDWTPAPEDVDSNIANVENNIETRLDEVNTSVQSAQTTIDQLSNMISHLVTDANGESLMTQTSDGWTFNMSSINDNLNAIKDAMADMESDQNSSDSALEKLTNLVNEVVNKTAYITMSTDDNGDPCIELGKTDSLFKVRITNQAIDFLEGSAKIAYANNNTFYSEKIIVKNELQIGEGPGFVWRTRANGNIGLVYIVDPNEINNDLWNSLFTITSYNGSPVINDNPTITFSGTATSSSYANLSENAALYSSGTISHVAMMLDAGKTLSIELIAELNNIGTIKVGYFKGNSTFVAAYSKTTTSKKYTWNPGAPISVTNSSSSSMIINGFACMFTTLDSTAEYSVVLRIKSVTIS